MPTPSRFMGMARACAASQPSSMAAPGSAGAWPWHSVQRVANFFGGARHRLAWFARTSPAAALGKEEDGGGRQNINADLLPGHDYCLLSGPFRPIEPSRPTSCVVALPDGLGKPKPPQDHIRSDPTVKPGPLDPTIHDTAYAPRFSERSVYAHPGGLIRETCALVQASLRYYVAVRATARRHQELVGAQMRT